MTKTKEKTTDNPNKLLLAFKSLTKYKNKNFSVITNPIPKENIMKDKTMFFLIIIIFLNY